MNAAQEKLSTAVPPAKAVFMDHKQALQALVRGARVSNKILEHLWRKGLIEVREVTDLDNTAGEKDLRFTFIKERGRRLLQT